MNLRRRNDQLDDGPLAEINTTPLIDVMLVLLVILLLATPLAFESSFGVRKGSPLAQPAVAEDLPDRVELAITGEDRGEGNCRAGAVVEPKVRRGHGGGGVTVGLGGTGGQVGP